MKLIKVDVLKWNGQDMGKQPGTTVQMVLNTESIVMGVQNSIREETTIKYYDTMDGGRPVEVLVSHTVTAVAALSNQLHVAVKLERDDGYDLDGYHPISDNVMINFDRIIFMHGLDATGGADGAGVAYKMDYDESRTNCAGMDTPFANRYRVLDTDMEDLHLKYTSLVGCPGATAEGGVPVTSLTLRGKVRNFLAGTVAWFSIKRVGLAYADTDTYAIVKFKGDKIGHTFIKTGLTLDLLVAETFDNIAS